MLIGPSEQSEQSVRVGKFKQLTIPSGDFEVQETKGGVGSIMQCAALLALKEGRYWRRSRSIFFCESAVVQLTLIQKCLPENESEAVKLDV